MINYNCFNFQLNLLIYAYEKRYERKKWFYGDAIGFTRFKYSSTTKYLRLSKEVLSLNKCSSPTERIQTVTGLPPVIPAHATKLRSKYPQNHLLFTRAVISLTHTSSVSQQLGRNFRLFVGPAEVSLLQFKLQSW